MYIAMKEAIDSFLLALLAFAIVFALVGVVGAVALHFAEPYLH